MTASRSQLAPLVDRLNQRVLALETSVEALRRGASEQCFAYYQKTGAQSFTSAVAANVLYDHVIEDARSTFNTATGIWTCPANAGGLFIFSAAVDLNSSATIGTMIFTLTAGANSYRFMRNEAAPAGLWSMSGTATCRMSPGDTAFLQLYQSTGSSQPLELGTATNWLTVARIPGSG